MTNHSGGQFEPDPLKFSNTTSVCYSGEAPNMWWPFLYQPYVASVACEHSIEGSMLHQISGSVSWPLLDGGGAYVWTSGLDVHTRRLI